MKKVEILNDDHIDDHVDNEIINCFNVDNPRCFFVFSGAGSGKTRSLVNAMTYLYSYIGEKLGNYSQKIAVITYTNAACNEILSRVDYRDLFSVSTIHSFLWELIKYYQKDIKDWVINDTTISIKELEEKQKNGRSSSTAEKREKSIQSKKERIEKIVSISKFSYNPNGDNIGYGSLNHSEVIKMGINFIMNNENLQKILISRFPIILIDESQDTKKELIDTLLFLDKKYNKKIIIGMFGDMMQRIYSDGKENLPQCIPDNWEKPLKIMNHRSAKRIITLANDIRNKIDGVVQKSRSDAEEGFVRLFIADNNSDKAEVERYVINKMSEITDDADWRLINKNKYLILEHHMASKRLGFSELFEPLYNIDSFRTGLMDGSLPELRLFTNVVLPIVIAHKNNNKFEIAKVIKKYSLLLSKKDFIDSTEQTDLIETVNILTDKLLKLWDKDNDPSCLEVLKNIEDNNMFEIPTNLQGISSLNPDELHEPLVGALYNALSSKFSQMEKYSEYVSGNSTFDTHQGVKGLEFPRVMVIMDDLDARGFLFSYEKLFGATVKTSTDISNEQKGIDNSISRTTRLLYVTCTRAMNSLALLAYSGDCNATKATALSNKWFKENEIEIIK